jgi:predicted GNAT family acetyltransferase
MDRDILLARFDHERRHLARDGEKIELLPLVTRLGGADGSWRSVVWSSLTPENADVVIAQEIEHHRRLGVSFEWKLYAHDTPPDLTDRLRRHGFHVGEREAVLVFDLTTPRNWIDGTDVSGTCRVQNVDQVELYRRVAEEAFDGRDERDTAAQLAAALLAGSTQHRGYIAYDGDEPASVGRLYTHPDSAFGGLYGGGTRPGFRGRGFYRALVAARARDALAAGAKYLQVDAMPTSRPILERLGFQWVTETWPCVWKPE